MRNRGQPGPMKGRYKAIAIHRRTSRWHPAGSHSREMVVIEGLKDIAAKYKLGRQARSP